MERGKRRAWDDTGWLRAGDVLEYLDRPGRPKGERVLGEGAPETRWLCVGALGLVVEVKRGYPRHRCPDHVGAPDCVCGDGEVGDAPGWVPERGPCALVEWETDRPGLTMRRLVHPEDEGEDWRRKEAANGT